MNGFKISNSDRILCDRCGEYSNGGFCMNRAFYCHECQPKQIKEDVLRSVIKYED